MVALKWEKHIVIISTSVLGAYITLRSISWVYGGWPPEMQIANYISDEAYGKLPTSFWEYLAGSVLLALIGIVVQYKTNKLKAKTKKLKQKLIDKKRKRENDFDE